MRVVHLCQRDNPRDGGAYRVALELVACQIAQGVDAHLVFLYEKPGLGFRQFGERAHYLNITSPTNLLQLLRLNRLLKTLKPDIVHDHQPVLWSLIATYFHPRWRRVTHAHTGSGVRSFGLKTRLVQFLQPRTTDLLVCISTDTQRSWVATGDYKQQKTAVIFNGVNTQQFLPPTPEQRQNARTQFGFTPEHLVVGFVGRLHNIMKGADDLIRALPFLPEQARVLIVGTGPDETALRELAQSLGLAERVCFAGALEETRQGYHAMDVFCLTSHFEHFGLVVGEAMAAGLPTMRFACPGGINDFHTKDVGWIVPQRRPEDLAAAILEAHSQWLDEQRSRNKRAATEELLRTKLNWEANTRDLIALYKSLLNK